MKSGIYKITSPSGRIYIGSSKDISHRWTYYFNLRCKQQTILYNSLLKHGVESHIFEVIEHCHIDLLLDRERFFAIKYNVLDSKKGLNCHIPGVGDKLVEYSNEFLKRRSLMNKGHKNPFFGKSHTKETKELISRFHAGKIPHNKGIKGVYKASEKAKNNMSVAQIGRKHSALTLLKMREVNKNLKIVLNTETGLFYFGSKEAAIAHNIKPNTLKGKLNGNRKNNTKFMFT